MSSPGSTELFLILGIIVILLLMVSPTYYLAKKKNLSIGWNIFWTIMVDCNVIQKSKAKTRSINCIEDITSTWREIRTLSGCVFLNSAVR